jgi:hypothetical protein
MRVTVAQVNGTLAIHKAGCSDTRRIKNDSKWNLDIASVRDVVEDTYGPAAGSFYAETGLPEGDPNNWQEFRSEFVIAPCVSLPETVPTGTHEGAQVEAINGHDIGRTDRGNGKWTATCGTCAVKITHTPVLASTLAVKIAEHIAKASAISAALATLDAPQEATSAPVAPELPAVLVGTRMATVEDVGASKPRRGGKVRGVTVTQTVPRPRTAKVVPINGSTGRPKIRVSASGMENFRYLAENAATESARQFWSRYMRERVEVVA